ncbi:MAG: hypothetical protein ABIH71_02330 [Candidatus Omnitrophota bacterium]
MRGLSKGFIMDFKGRSLLSPVLERVKNDSTLCLEIRENHINIYYRGGNIMRIKENNDYVVFFDKKYCKLKKADKVNIPKIIKNLPAKLKVKSDVSAWVMAFPFLKQVMDFWFNENREDEREFQQLILRENNGSRVGNSTDYFMIDIEYNNHKGACFDLVAVEWESESVIRKLKKGYKPKLSFIEVKYGDNALSGPAGMLKHIKDFKDYLKSDPGLKMIREEMIKIFAQKRELGLIPALINNKNILREFSDEIDYIFLLANHDPASRKLYNILMDIQKASRDQSLGFGLKFCASNFMGYGLYKQNVYLFADFIERFKKQIICNS